MKKIKIFNLELEEKRFVALAEYFSEIAGTCLLLSGGKFDSATNSFIWLFPTRAFSIVSKEQKIEKNLPFEEILYCEDNNAWDVLKKALGDFKTKEDFPKWVGYLSYEFAKTYNHPNKKNIPLAYFQSCAIVFKYNHVTKHLCIFICEDQLENLSEEQKHWVERFSKDHFLKGFLKDLSRKSKKESHLKITTPFSSKAKYFEQIEQIKELIKEGEVYEVNLSHEMVAKGSFDPFSFFKELHLLNPAPFSCYFKLKDFYVVSSSPERFLLKEDQDLESRPIKGTINRGKNLSEDFLNKNYLFSSEKEKSELRMITDLLRNDLYKVSEKGSIHVEELFRIEKYANVFHMLSVIKAKAKKDVHPISVLEVCFPGGSITGCPKLASQNTIAALEKRERGIYTGSIGYFTSKGNFDFNIAIRTVLFQQDLIYIPVGGAILLDSDQEKEYAETYYKAESMLKALNIFLNP